MANKATLFSASKRQKIDHLMQETLAAVPLFSHLDPRTLSRLTTQLKQKTYKRREVIYHTGESSNALFIVCSGKVKLTKITCNGEDAFLSVVGKNNYFGESELVDFSQRTLTATSIGITDVVVLPVNVFHTLLKENAEFSAHVLSTIVHRLRKLNDQIGDIYFQDLSTRIGLSLLELGQDHGNDSDQGLIIDVYLTQSDIAEMCGATRVSVNKVLGEFRRNGWISITNRRFMILDMFALKQFVSKSAV